MARILFCAELGNGYGHVTRLLPLALALQARGHEVVFAVNDLPKAELVLGPHGFRLFQCPAWPLRVGGLPPIRNYTDILLRHGFLDPVGLRGMVRAWRALVSLLAPALVLGDHAPMALFATQGLVPARLRFGDGFCCPPLATPMPPLAWWALEAGGFDAVGERNLVQVANAVAPSQGLPAVASVAQLLRADDDLLCTVPELDHYAQRPAGAMYAGPVLDDAPVQDAADALPAWPAGAGPRVFVYLRGEYPHLEALVRALEATGCRAILHVPGLPPAHPARAAGARQYFSARPVAMRLMREACDFAICHGGYGSTHSLLMAGVPMLLLPTQMEQTMLARRAVDMGAGLACAPGPAPPDFPAALARLRSDTSLRVHAGAFAGKYAGQRPRATLDALVQRVEAQL